MNYSFSFPYIVHNGGIYLWYSLKNTLNLCDFHSDSEIIIIGGYDNFFDASEIRGESSVDETERIIKSFNSDRIKYYSLGRRGDYRQLWNEAFARFGDTDFVFKRYEDEFIKPEDFIKLARKIGKKDVIDLPLIELWGDFSHRFLNERFSERIFRNMAGIGYIEWYDYINDTTGKKLRETEKFLRLGIPIFKYEKVRPKERLLKQELRKVKEKNWIHRSLHPLSNWQIVDPLKYVNKIEPFLPGGEIVPKVKFSDLKRISLKEQPEEIQNHPFSDLPMGKIWESAIFPSFLNGSSSVLTLKEKKLRILEFGCGPSLVLKQFQKDENECWGVDPSEFAVQHGRKLGLKMVRATLEGAWFQSNFFDLIFGIDALEHSKNPTKGFRNLHSWLKPGGTLILCSPNAEHNWTEDKEHFLWSPRQHYSIPSSKALKDLTEKSGFEVVSLQEKNWNLWLKAIKRGSLSEEVSK